ncbi:hypothetical protein GBF38_000630 [Nibea albiflora]|nr:hypothetical protein GBF38_000630 [Nibea albiflora]
MRRSASGLSHTSRRAGCLRIKVCAESCIALFLSAQLYALLGSGVISSGPSSHSRHLPCQGANLCSTFVLMVAKVRTLFMLLSPPRGGQNDGLVLIPVTQLSGLPAHLDLERLNPSLPRDKAVDRFTCRSADGEINRGGDVMLSRV